MSDYVNDLFYRCHKMSLNRGRSYIDPPKWTKNKTIVNPKNISKLKSSENVCKNHNFCNSGGKVKKCLRDAAKYLI